MSPTLVNQAITPNKSHTWALWHILSTCSGPSLLSWFLLAFRKPYYGTHHLPHSAWINSIPYTKHSNQGRVRSMPQNRWYDEDCRYLHLDNLKYSTSVVLSPQYKLAKKCTRWNVVRDERGRHPNIGNSTICSWLVVIVPLHGGDYGNEDHKHPTRIPTLGAHIQRYFTKPDTLSNAFNTPTYHGDTFHDL